VQTKQKQEETRSLNNIYSSICDRKIAEIPATIKTALVVDDIFIIGLFSNEDV
jgi:hypothetical protein